MLQAVIGETVDGQMVRPGGVQLGVSNLNRSAKIGCSTKHVLAIVIDLNVRIPQGDCATMGILGDWAKVRVGLLISSSRANPLASDSFDGTLRFAY